jgi:hypothetical protein
MPLTPRIICLEAKERIQDEMENINAIIHGNGLIQEIGEKKVKR